jgi:hypothetical protein
MSPKHNVVHLNNVAETPKEVGALYMYSETGQVCMLCRINPTSYTLISLHDGEYIILPTSIEDIFLRGFSYIGKCSISVKPL